VKFRGGWFDEDAAAEVDGRGFEFAGVLLLGPGGGLGVVVEIDVAVGDAEFLELVAGGLGVFAPVAAVDEDRVGEGCHVRLPSGANGIWGL